MARAKSKTKEEIKEYQASYRAAHRDKARKYAKEYYRGNPEKFNGIGGWGRHLRHWYGITLEQWNNKLVQQAGECAICGDQMYKPHVDHDHETGRARGLLCNECNHLVGDAKERPEVLLSAIQYLAKHKGT